MFDFFKFRNNNIGIIKSGAQSTLLVLTLSLNEFIDSEGPLLTAGLITSLVALNLYLYKFDFMPKIIYKESQPGTAGQENGFYLIENTSFVPSIARHS